VPNGPILPILTLSSSGLQNPSYKVAVTLRKAVVEHKPKSLAAKSMAAVADEMIARLDSRTGSLVSGSPMQGREVA